MNYEEFKERLSEDLKQDLYERTGNEHYIEPNNVAKLQNQSYEALNIRPENSPIAVSLDVRSMFEPYEQTGDYDKVHHSEVDIVTKGFVTEIRK